MPPLPATVGFGRDSAARVELPLPGARGPLRRNLRRLPIPLAPSAREGAVTRRPEPGATPAPTVAPGRSYTHQPQATKRSTMIRTRSIQLIAGAAAVPIVALVVAGCGGGSSGATAASPPSQTASGHAAKVAKPVPNPSPQPATTKAPAPAPAPTTTTQAAPPTPAASGIPQNNGGDADSDNNGGPSDGDGDI